MKQRFWWYSVGGIVSVLIALAPLSAHGDDSFFETEDEVGPVGEAEDGSSDETNPEG